MYVGGLTVGLGGPLADVGGLHLIQGTIQGTQSIDDRIPVRRRGQIDARERTECAVPNGVGIGDRQDHADAFRATLMGALGKATMRRNSSSNGTAPVRPS